MEMVTKQFQFSSASFIGIDVNTLLSYHNDLPFDARGLISNTGSNEKEVMGTTKPDFVAQVKVGVSDDGSLEILPPDVQAITPDSVIADIQLAYDNGWLKNKKIRGQLIKQIKAMVKVEKKSVFKNFSIDN